MSGWMAPTQDRESWSKLQVALPGGWVLFPGLVKVTCNRVIGYDDKPAAGQNGATTTRKGEELKEWTTEHYLTDEPWPPSAAEIPEGRTYVDDFYQWNGAELVLAQSYAGEKPLALQLYHPELARQGVSAGTVREIGGFQDNGDGSGVVPVKWKEHREPTPTGGGSGGGAKKDDPEQRTEADDTIDRLREESKQLDEEYKNL